MRMKLSNQAREVVPPAVSGWVAGTPQFEANPSLTQMARTGSLGAPGIYDEMVQQWESIATGMERGRSRLAALKVEMRPPRGADPIDVEWNRRAFAWLGENAGLQDASGIRYGMPELLAWAHDVVWYGFGVLVPVWHEDDHIGTMRGKVTLQPLVRSAVRRWWTHWRTMEVEAVDYQGSSDYQRIAYDELIHITWGGQPGELFGQGALRPMVGPFFVWRGTVVFVGQQQSSMAGRLIMVESSNIGSEVDATRLDEAGQQFDAGSLRWARLPSGTEYSFEAATGSAPDPTVACAWADAQANRMFASRTSSLATASHGSYAMAETLGEEDETWALERWDRVIGDVCSGVLAWLARETGYTGTVFRVQIAANDDTGDTQQDTAAVVTSLAQAVTAGLMRWTPQDEEELRRRLAWNVDAKTVLADAGSHTCGSECGGDGEEVYLADAGLRLSLSDTRPHSIEDRDGARWPSWREAMTIEIRGVEVQPERFVAWLADDAADVRMLNDFAVTLAPMFEEHRSEIRALLAEAGGGRQLATLRERWVGRYLSAMLVESRTWVASGVARARAEAGVQSATRVVASEASAASSSMAATVERVRAASVSMMLTQSAEEIASRVQGDAIGATVGGLLPANYVPRVTSQGLARTAAAPMRQAQESAQLVESAVEQPDGLSVVAFVRTSVRDPRVCAHCAGRDNDGRRFVFPEDQAEFLSYIQTFGPPDPQCEGGSRYCRCRFVPIYGRRR